LKVARSPADTTDYREYRLPSWRSHGAAALWSLARRRHPPHQPYPAPSQTPQERRFGAKGAADRRGTGDSRKARRRLATASPCVSSIWPNRGADAASAILRARGGTMEAPYGALQALEEAGE